MIAAIKQSLAKIVVDGEKNADFDYVVNEITGQLTFKYLQLSPHGKKPSETPGQIASEGGDGHIIQDENYLYQMQNLEGNHRPKILATDKEGRQRWYSYDSKTGIAGLSSLNYESRNKIYILTPGHAYGKIRKILDFTQEGKIETEYSAQFSNEGGVVRELWRDGKKLIYLYNSQNQLSGIEAYDVSGHKIGEYKLK